MKYTVYFDEKYLKEDGDLITVCESVDSIEIARAKIGSDMINRNLGFYCRYMYKLYEEDHSNLDAYNLPASQELFWEDIPTTA